ncbi:MAG: helical backbone metal receptor [Deltaproteobacteria bacterium]|nr:helical backbone metal receptor [Deltaproteobacteria bacterium]
MIRIFIVHYIVFFFLTLSISFASQPRIISLSPPITEELYLLGMRNNIVANTIYCTRPEDAKTKEKVGSVINVNLERVIRLKPDIVFTSPLMDRRLVQKMEKLGITVYTFPHPKNFEEICHRFLRVSEIFGKKEMASEMVLHFTGRYKTLKENIPPGAKKHRVFIQLGKNPLFTATKDSILNSFIEDAGGENIAKDTKTGLFSKEELFIKDPNYIIIVSMGIEGEQQIKEWKKNKELKAVREGNIYLVDSHTYCSPTIKSYLEGVETLRDIFLGRRKKQ